MKSDMNHCPKCDLGVRIKILCNVSYVMVKSGDSPSKVDSSAVVGIEEGDGDGDNEGRCWDGNRMSRVVGGVLEGGDWLDKQTWKDTRMRIVITVDLIFISSWWLDVLGQLKQTRRDVIASPDRLLSTTWWRLRCLTVVTTCSSSSGCCCRHR